MVVPSVRDPFLEEQGLSFFGDLYKPERPGDL